jgi:hypothetical protein
MNEYVYDHKTDAYWYATEERLNQLKGAWNDTPTIHLYDWLQVAHPEVFKQWQAVYDIEKE